MVVWGDIVMVLGDCMVVLGDCMVVLGDSMVGLCSLGWPGGWGVTLLLPTIGLS